MVDVIKRVVGIKSRLLHLLQEKRDQYNMVTKLAQKNCC